MPREVAPQLNQPLAPKLNGRFTSAPQPPNNRASASPPLRITIITVCMQKDRPMSSPRLQRLTSQRINLARVARYVSWLLLVALAHFVTAPVAKSPIFDLIAAGGRINDPLDAPNPRRILDVAQDDMIIGAILRPTRAGPSLQPRLSWTSGAPAVPS